MSLTGTLARASFIRRFMGLSHEGKRDMYAAFGYPNPLTTGHLYAMYLRNGIANRIVKAYPQATWRDVPQFNDGQGNTSEEGDDYSVFVESVEKALKKHKLLRLIERADRLSSIGRYGLIVFGFNDGARMSEPLMPGNHELLWTSAYSEGSVTVQNWNMDPKSARHSLPQTYNVTAATFTDGAQPATKSMNVHYSRCIHVSEFLDENDVYGVPRLHPIYNHLMDLEKVVGGSAETFWITANRGIALSAADDHDLSPEDYTKAKEESEAFVNGLTRNMVLQGMNATVLGSEDPDPGPNATVLLDLISGGSGIPKRILLGTERGELSSAQDENNWSERIDERRVQYATPMLLTPVINLLIATGNIIKPQGDWNCEWPDSGTLGPVAQADLGLARTNALVAYANSPGASLIVPESEFRQEILQLDPVSSHAIAEVEPDLPEDDPVDVPDDDETAPVPPVNTNATPKSLYVRRNVLNAAAIRDWAASQGFKDIVPDLHVTVMYSKKHVDWMQFSPSYAEDDDGAMMIHPGGARSIEKFGDAIVLSFASDGLQWRHREMRQGGCSYDHTIYQPHVTITYSSEGIDATKIAAYQGAIALGPEIFEEVKA